MDDELLRLIAFDLDGTLARSKYPVGRDICNGLKELVGDLYDYDIAIVTGADFNQTELQVFPFLEMVSFPFNRLFLVTVNGGKVYYRNVHDEWTLTYPTSEITFREYESIKTGMRKCLKYTDWFEGLLDHVYGNIFEWRQAQVTYSALGQDAPLYLKEVWDPERIKRLPLRSDIAERLPKYDVSIGGTTSIDVTPKGVNKATGLLQIMNILSLEKEDVLYVGDALQPGGNDHVIVEYGFENWNNVVDPSDTLSIIKGLLE